MYLFLDIDGVLNIKENHPWTHGEPPAFDKQCLIEFESVIRTNSAEKIKIVISSTWRQVYSIEKIRALFSADLQDKIVGVTPDTYGRIEDYERQNEVMTYLNSSGNKDFDWIAIDDDQYHYKPDADLVLTERYTGFDHKAAFTLTGMIS